MRQSSVVGMMLSSAKGSSQIPGTSRTMASVSAGVTTCSSCRVRRWPATARACPASSHSFAEKPMAKLRTSAPVAAISAVTRLESMPPERKAPSGTSATMRRATASRSSASSSSTEAVRPLACASRPASAASRSDQ